MIVSSVIRFTPLFFKMGEGGTEMSFLRKKKKKKKTVFFLKNLVVLVRRKE